MTDGSTDAGIVPEAEAGPPAPPHRVFVTSRAYTGDLVSAANGLLADAGIPAPDGGTFGPTQGRQAADAICQWHASSAGLPGTFKAVIYSGGTSPFTSMTDADGPWALVDGTPVAEKVSDLKNGYLHASVDLTETGVSTPFGYGAAAYVWQGWSTGGYDCEQWTSGVAAPADAAALQASVTVGQYRSILPWQGGAAAQCNDHEPLHCIEVGSGGGPNAYPVPASGSKLVFVTGPVTGDFVAPDGGVIDAGADAGSDAVHARADQICAAAATAAGRSGTFHAYITSSTTTGQAYFTAHSMNGPWVRPDGFPVAANLAALTGSGPLSSQIALNADGTFATGFLVAFTGTNATGALVNNCADYSTKASASLTNEMYVIWKDLSAMWGQTYCNQIGKLACFEQ